MTWEPIDQAEVAERLAGYIASTMVNQPDLSWLEAVAEALNICATFEMRMCRQRHDPLALARERIER